MAKETMDKIAIENQKFVDITKGLTGINKEEYGQQLFHRLTDNERAKWLAIDPDCVRPLMSEIDYFVYLVRKKEIENTIVVYYHSQKILPILNKIMYYLESLSTIGGIMKVPEEPSLDRYQHAALSFVHFLSSKRGISRVDDIGAGLTDVERGDRGRIEDEYGDEGYKLD